MAGMYKSLDPKTIAFLAVGTWPLAFLWAFLNPELRWIAAYWIPLAGLALVIIPGLWYVVRYIPDDIRRYLSSRRRQP
jgi:hypothetical protein